MFSIIKFFKHKTEKTPMFTQIIEGTAGFYIADRSGNLVVPTSYTRRRDAVRGATRRGFAVA